MAFSLQLLTLFAPLLAVAATSRTLPPQVEASADEDFNANTPPRFRGRRVQRVYAAIDALCICVCGALAFLLRFPPQSLHRLQTPSTLIGMDNRYAAFLLLDVALILLFCHSEHLYRTPLEISFSIELLSIVKAITFATLLLISFLYLSATHTISRAVVLISAVMNIAAFAVWRYAKRRYIVRRREHGIGARNALIVGAGKIGQALAEAFETQKLLGYNFIGFLDSDHASDSRILGNIADLRRVARRYFVDEIFITLPSARTLVRDVALEARRHRLAVNVIPDLYDGLAWNAPLRRLGRFPVMDLHSTSIPAGALAAKRFIDVCLASIGLFVTAPLIGVLALFVRRDSPGPAFYRSLRVGRKGQIFTCYKLRTMLADADQLKSSLRSRNERDGAFFKIADDPRVTPIGKLLRRYSLDELPQLWNVLTGDMSLVGPRPHPVDDFNLYQLEDLRRLDMKPGITGLWQVSARQDPSFHRSVMLDLDYIENWTLCLDMRIILRTFASLVRAEGC
jgi:exopolysaccharide biosynthesis polyprenyl glycosylphosphotransferase